MLGAAATVAAGGQPGILLGAFVVAGTLAAALAVRGRAVYLLIPVPALAYPVAALAAGVAGGHGGASRTALTISAAQWVAGGFVAMTAATILVVGVAAARWPRRGHGRPRPPGGRPPGAGPGRPRRVRDAGSPAARRRRPGHPGYPLSAG